MREKGSRQLHEAIGPERLDRKSAASIQDELAEDAPDHGRELEAVCRKPEGVEQIRCIDRRADDGNLVRCETLDAGPEPDDARASGSAR